MIRVLALAFVVMAATACGKYGAPVRAPVAGAPAAKTAPVSAAPADTEECADPNAPTAPNEAAKGTTP